MVATFTRASARSRRWGDTGLAAGALLLLPGSEVIWQSVILAVYAVTLMMLYRDRDRIWTLVRSAWPAFLPVLLAVCSVWWSVDPALTAYRVMALAGTTSLGIFLAIRFSVEEQLRLLALVLGIMACASALVALFLPSYGVMPAPLEGAWSGIFFHKNSLGRVMALATLVFSLLVLGTRRLRGVVLLGLALCTALLVLSRSLGSLIVAVACLAAVGILSAMKRRTGRAPLALVVLGGTLVVFAAMWAVQHRADILAVIGRDPTFNGRTPLWAALGKTVHIHPWVGNGYGAFWRGPDLMSRELTRALRRYPIHAHNGFLDLVLELGIAGLLLFLLPLCMYGRRLYVWGMARPSPLFLWPVTYLLFLVLSNLAESALVRQNTLYWALYVAAVLSVEASASARTRVGVDSETRGEL